MKRFAFLAMLAVLGITGTAAARPGVPNDGTLTVKDANGRIVINGKGAVIGRFDKGQVTIKDPNPNDGKAIVTGADVTQSLAEKTTRYSGSNVRFRIIGGVFTITVYGNDIDLSVIGRGIVALNGTAAGRGNGDDGTYSINGEPAQPFPDFLFTFPLASQPSPGG